MTSISTVYLLFFLAVFLSQEEHHDLLPLNGNNFTLFVHGIKCYVEIFSSNHIPPPKVYNEFENDIIVTSEYQVMYLVQ